MRHLPAFFDLAGRRVVVVGTTAQATQRAELAQAAGASVTRHDRVPAEDAIAGAALMFVASDSPEDAAQAAETGRRAGVPVNVVDQPALCDFIIPAIVDRGSVVVGISTGGASPSLARRIRETVEGALPARIGRLADLAQAFRSTVRAMLPDAGRRRSFWDNVVRGPIAELVFAGRETVAREKMLAVLNRPAAAATERGSVHLVGAGPGDPDLLTMHALRALQRAEVVLYDELVSPEVVDRSRRDARRINVGKRKGLPSHRQHDINELMLSEAAAGRTVVRLKGGDPFIFGRGGEELAFLEQHGIDVFVVPGITAALGCAAAARLPLTLRNHAAAVTFVTGHLDESSDTQDWGALARSGNTLVVYMGLSAATAIRTRLLAAGLPGATPVAIISGGTTDRQQVRVDTVERLPLLAAQFRGGDPALIVIGSVAALAQTTDQVPLAMAS